MVSTKSRMAVPMKMSAMPTLFEGFALVTALRSDAGHDAADEQNAQTDPEKHKHILPKLTLKVL